MKWRNPYGDIGRRTIDEDRIVEIILFNGWPFELEAGAGAPAEAAARAALETLVGLGLPYASSGQGRLFDPVELAHFVRWAGLYAEDRLFEDRYLAVARRLIWQTFPGYPSTPAPPPSIPPVARRWTLTIERRFNLEAWRPGERVRLRLPLPLEEAPITDLRTEILGPADLRGQTRMAPGRLDVVITVPDEPRVTIGIRSTFTEHPRVEACSPLDPEEAHLYTRPNEGLIRTSDGVIRLAAELAGAETDTLSLIKRFWVFLYDRFSLNPVHYDQLDPIHPLDSALAQGWGDCVVAAAVLVALCRARGVPARMVRGIILWSGAPRIHSWLEAWIPGRGWLAFDPIDVSLGGRDQPWRDIYFGGIDHRVVFERPPLLFSGTGTPRLPAAWHMLTFKDGPGAVVEFRTVDTDRLIYLDRMRVEQSAP